MRWRRGHHAWLDSFSDRVCAQDGFSFNVTYHVEVRGADASAPCVQRSAYAAMRAIAEPALARCDVLRPGAAEQDVNSELARSLPTREAGVFVAQCRIEVRADAETVEAAKRLADARQHAKVDAVELDRLRARMAFLETEVIRDNATLRLYLFAEEIEHDKRFADKDVEALESLANEVRKWSPTNRWVETAKILHDYVNSLHPSDVLDLVSALRESICEHEELGLLRRFDAVHGLHK